MERVCLGHGPFQVVVFDQRIGFIRVYPDEVVPCDQQVSNFRVFGDRTRQLPAIRKVSRVLGQELFDAPQLIDTFKEILVAITALEDRNGLPNPFELCQD